MKKIIASVMALLMICSSQTSALNKESTVKKVVYNVCTKVLPIAAVTLGAGFLVKKFVIDRENNDPAQPELVSGNNNKMNTNCGKSNRGSLSVLDRLKSVNTDKKDKSSNNVPAQPGLVSENDSKINTNCSESNNKEKKVCSRPTFNTNNVSVSASQLKSVNTDKKDKSSSNVPLTEQQAHDDGIRGICWHNQMCWFNASILYLYYFNAYRDFLCDMEETTYNEEDSTCKKITIELANLVKKIRDSKKCMCYLTEEDYKKVLAFCDPMYTYKFDKGTNELVRDKSIPLEYGKVAEEISGQFARNITEYAKQINKNINLSLSPDNNIPKIIWSRNHYYILYYSKNTNRLYSIGKIPETNFEDSIKIFNPDKDAENKWVYDMFDKYKYDINFYLLTYYLP